jgi:carbonic anhydrase/acetyltransferase-like protein (isoleucine patch superfamily)
VIHEFRSKRPVIDHTAFVADSAEIIGDVKIGEFSSIWFNAVIRGDVGSIHIGKRTSIQDNAVIHTDTSMTVEIKDNVTVGHGAVLHGCIIGNNIIVGMNATVLNDAVIGDNSIIGANALVSTGRVFLDGSVILGVPGEVKRQVTDSEKEHIEENAATYVEPAKEYKDMMQDE